MTFADPLTEPINNWKTTANPDARHCAYRFTGTGCAIKSAPEFTCPALPEFEPELDSLASSRIESDVRFLSEVSPSQDGGLAFGLGCRTSGSGEGSRDYFIEVFASGSFSLAQNSGTGVETGFTKLSSGSNEEFRSVAGQWRRLRLDCDEEADGSLRISAWLDGRTLVESEVVKEPWPPRRSNCSPRPRWPRPSRWSSGTCRSRASPSSEDARTTPVIGDSGSRARFGGVSVRALRHCSRGPGPAEARLVRGSHTWCSRSSLRLPRPAARRRGSPRAAG